MQIEAIAPLINSEAKIKCRALFRGGKSKIAGENRCDLPPENESIYNESI